MHTSILVELKKTVLLTFALVLLSTAVVVRFIRPVETSGTIYIRADGSVEPDTAPISSVDNITYTFTDNIYDSIVVERDNIVVDGAGYRLQGMGAYYSKGIDLTVRSNVTIRSMKIEAFWHGIWLNTSSNNCISGNEIANNRIHGVRVYESSNNTITGNNIKNNSRGVRLEYSSSYNTVSANNITNNEDGVELYLCSNVTISGNTVTNNSHYGIWLHSSSNVTISGNVMNRNKCNFGVWGFKLSYFTHSIDVSNLVNGKPVYYLANQKNIVTNPATHPQVGFLALINCANVTVEGLTLTNNGQGLLLAYTNNSRITGNNITNNDVGLVIQISSNITISGNNITNNVFGVGFDSSSNNIISGNNITANNIHNVCLTNSSNITVSGNTVANSDGGIILYDCSKYNTISGNNITANNWDGIYVYNSSSNTISGNNITANNNNGIVIRLSSNYNTVCGNDITANNLNGIYLEHSSNNIFYHNNFVSNTNQVQAWANDANAWDNGLEGNYWSNYTGVDSNHDGIGDSYHVIDANNTDHCPLMGMFSDFVATSEYHVQTVCNSSISDFQFNGTAICFNVTGENDTNGFCRICIPRALMNETYKVFVNGTEVPGNLLPCSNSTYSYLYFTYTLSTQEVIVIPEFPTLTPMLLILIVLTVSIVIYKRRLLKTPIH